MRQPSGLAAYLFSRDAARIWRAAEGIEAEVGGPSQEVVALHGDLRAAVLGVQDHVALG